MPCPPAHNFRMVFALKPNRSKISFLSLRKEPPSDCGPILLPILSVLPPAIFFNLDLAMDQKKSENM